MHERFDTCPSYGKFAHAAPAVRKRYSSQKINTIASGNSGQNKKIVRRPKPSDNRKF